jgi:NDP-sugar pyrophosphorylase family protein
MTKQAVILAGGLGSRLRPYTTVIPKPLMPLGDVPIIEVVIEQLKSHGFSEVIISTGYMADLIMAYLGDGKRWAVRIRYVRESKPLGTAGALKLIKNLASDFLVINGDILTDLNFSKLFKFHQDKRAAATIAVASRVIKTDFGVVEFDREKHLTGYFEKPQHQSFVSMGINILNRKAVSLIKNGERIGMPELFCRMNDSGEKVLCYENKASWLDLGRLEDLETAQQLWEKHKKRFLKSK